MTKRLSTAAFQRIFNLKFCPMYTMLLASLLNIATLQAEQTHFAASCNQLPGEVTEVVLYYPGGQVLQRGYVEDGMKTGMWVTYAQSGSITAKAFYNTDVKTGTWKIYDASGNLIYKIRYKNNKKQWAQQFNQEGELTAFAYK